MEKETGLESPSHVEKRKLLLALLLIGIAAFLAYANTLENEFVFDDHKIIRDNTSIRSLSNVPGIFRNMFVYQPLKGQGTKIDPSYRPLRYLSYAIDYQFTGLSPTGYHISNILYHIIASFLVFLLLRRLTRHFGVALGVTMLFVLHPVHTEAVAYLTGRKDVLCAIFYLLAFLAFLKYRDQPKLKYAVLLPLCFALAFMAKEMAITLPAVMMLYDLGRWFRRSKGGIKEFLRSLFSGANLAVYVPTVVLALLFSAAALLLKNPAGMGEEWIGYWGGSLYVSTLTMFRGVFHYMRLLFIPLGLTADYSYNAFPVSQSLFNPVATLLSMLVLGFILVVGAYLLARRRFLPGFAILFFFVSLIPVLQIVPLPERLAERFLYLPSLGLMILAALGLGWLLRRSAAARVLGLSALALLVVVFFALTYQRNRDWQNPFTLHKSVIALHPDCARSQLALAEEYSMRASVIRDRAAGALTAPAEQDYFNATHHFSRVLEILPPQTWRGWRRGYALNALAGRGIAYANMGKYEKATADLERVLEEKDVYGQKIAESADYLHVHFNLGEVYFSLKEFEKAVTEFDTVIGMARDREAREYLVRACFKKALSMAGLEKLQEGLQALLDGIVLARGTVHEISLQYHIGLYQLDLNMNEEAVGSFDRVLELCRLHEESPDAFTGKGPQSVILGIDKAKRQAYYMKAQALDRAGKFYEALEVLKQTVAMAPDYLEAHFSLGDFYFKKGDLDAAESEFRRVLKDTPDHTRSKEYLALIKVRRQAAEERRKPSPQKVLLLQKAASRDFAAGDIKEAEDKLTEALRILDELEMDSNLKLLASKVRLLLGRIRYEQDENEDARTHLRKCIELVSDAEPGTADFQLGEGRYWLALTISRQDDNSKRAALHFREAIPPLRAAASASKSTVEMVELLTHSAHANRTLGRYDEELSDCLKAAEQLPDYPGIQYMAAHAALRAKKPAEATRLFRESILRKTRIVESFYELGKLQFEHGKYTDAIADFETALQQTSDPYYLAACNYHLGHAYYALEMYEEAARVWREYLKHEKDSERRKLIERKLADDPKLKQR